MSKWNQRLPSSSAILTHDQFKHHPIYSTLISSHTPVANLPNVLISIILDYYRSSPKIILIGIDEFHITIWSIDLDQMHNNNWMIHIHQHNFCFTSFVMSKLLQTGLKLVSFSNCSSRQVKKVQSFDLNNDVLFKNYHTDLVDKKNKQNKQNDRGYLGSLRSWLSDFYYHHINEYTQQSLNVIEQTTKYNSFKYIQLTGERSHEILSIDGNSLEEIWARPHDLSYVVRIYNTITNRWSRNQNKEKDEQKNELQKNLPLICDDLSLSSLAIENHESSSSSFSSGIVYCFGGRNHLIKSSSSNIYTYNPLTNLWSSLPTKLWHEREEAVSIYVPKWEGFLICGGRYECRTRIQRYRFSIEFYSPVKKKIELIPEKQWSMPSFLHDCPQSIHLTNDYKLILIYKNNEPQCGNTKDSNCPVYVTDISPFSQFSDLLSTISITGNELQWSRLPPLPSPSSLPYNNLANHKYTNISSQSFRFSGCIISSDCIY
jgi:hypothetical protein